MEVCPGWPTTERMDGYAWELLIYSNYKHLIDKIWAHHLQSLLLESVV